MRGIHEREHGKDKSISEFAGAQKTYNQTGNLLNESDRALAEKANTRAQQTDGMTRQAYQSIIWLLTEEF